MAQQFLLLQSTQQITLNIVSHEWNLWSKYRICTWFGSWSTSKWKQLVRLVWAAGTIAGASVSSLLEMLNQHLMPAPVHRPPTPHTGCFPYGYGGRRYCTGALCTRATSFLIDLVPHAVKILNIAKTSLPPSSVTEVVECSAVLNHKASSTGIFGTGPRELKAGLL